MPLSQTLMIAFLDVYRISEYHSDNGKFWEILCTAILSAAVAFLAAWVQIRLQRKNEIRKKRDDLKVIREVVEVNIQEVIQILQRDLERLREYKLLIDDWRKLGVSNFNNTPIKIISSYPYSTFFEIYNPKIKVQNSGNLKGFIIWYNSIDEINSIYNTLTKDLSEHFTDLVHCSEDVDTNQNEILLAVRSIQQIGIDEQSKVAYKKVYQNLVELVDAYLSNPDIVYPDEKYKVSDKLYFDIIAAINLAPDEYEPNIINLRRLVIIGIKLVRNYGAKSANLKDLIQNWSKVLDQKRYSLENFLIIFGKKGNS